MLPRSQAARAPYPEPLCRAIVAKNHPLLRRNLSSYLHQLERAVAAVQSLIAAIPGAEVVDRAAALVDGLDSLLIEEQLMVLPKDKRAVARLSEPPSAIWR